MQGGALGSDTQMQRIWARKKDENQETGISKRERENADIMYTLQSSSCKN